jgi:hypothetical protein
MTKKEKDYPIYDLTPSTFVELCHDLLKAEFNYEKTFILDGPQDNGVDILALKGVEKIAIQVKHKYKLDRISAIKELEKYKSLLGFHHRLIFITSAKVDKAVVQEFRTDKISIISQSELFNLLDKHTDIAGRYFKVAEKRNKLNQRWLSSSFVGIILTIISSVLTFYIDKKDDKPLASKIDNVEEALKNINGLEKDLEEIKDDMIKTEIEKTRIIEEYEKVKGLEDVINEKKESLNLVLNYQPWYKKLLDYFLGVLTGIFTSIIASILYEKWRQQKALKN